MRGECLDPDAVLDLIGGKVAPELRRAAVEHMSSCEPCRELVSALASELSNPGSTSHDELTPTTLRPSGGGAALPASPPHETSASAEPPFAIGEDVTHYRMERTIGRGGMGRVFLARDLRLNRRIALKVIHPELVSSADAVQRFLSEARATAAFSHPNIVSIYDLGQHRGLPFVVLEYVEGRTLRELLSEERIDLARGLAVARAVAVALQEAHRRRILHRDLKPSNVMISADGRTRVLDFGLAKAVGGGGAGAPLIQEGALSTAGEHTVSVATRTGVISGTPPYMAPEQWAGEASFPADVWAFGLLLRELVGGEHPYSGLSLWQIREAVMSAAPVPGWPARADLPRRLRELVERCLAKDPGERPSMDEVVRVLGHVRPRRPIRAWFAATMIGLIALAGAGVLSSRVFDTREPMVVKGTRGATQKDPDPSVAPARARVESPALTPPAANPPGSAGASAQAARSFADPPKRRRRPRARDDAGTLVVQSVAGGAPMWADVFVDGRYRGRTPLVLRALAAGKHRLRLVREGFALDERDVIVQAGRARRILIVLRPRGEGATFAPRRAVSPLRRTLGMLGARR